MDQDEAMFGAEVKPSDVILKQNKPKTNWIKWFAFSAGGLLGLSHIGMMGLLMRNSNQLPSINIPVGEYTSYDATVGKDGYRITYKANDPTVMTTTKRLKEKAGFLGLADNHTVINEEYVMDSARSQGGPVSNPRSWIDPSALGKGGEEGPSAETIACIKKRGGGEQSGRLVGTSIGAAAAPTLSTIPFVGWLAAGWVAMFGGNQGANIGGDMATGGKC